MKTLQEAQDQVAKNYGWNSFTEFWLDERRMATKLEVINEAAELYAQSAKAEAWEEGFEAGKSWERKQIIGKESNPYKY